MSDQLYRRVMYGDLPDEYDYEPVTDERLSRAEWEATMKGEPTIRFMRTPGNLVAVPGSLIGGVVSGDWYRLIRLTVDAAIGEETP